MHVFVTGGTGLIGKGVVRELLDHGHTVLGLARSDESAETLRSLGAEVIRGDLGDVEVLKQGAGQSDGVAHLGFIHDFENFEQSCKTDREALQAMADGLIGSNRPLVATTGTMLLPHGRLGTEDDHFDASASDFALRGQTETLVRGFASQSIRSMVLRLAPVNHGPGDSQVLAAVINTAREKGVSAYIGDGHNRWPAVHYLDTAVAYRLALEHGAAGATYHVVAESGVEFRKIADKIGEKLGIPVLSKSEAEAKDQWGFFAGFVLTDNPVSSEKTQKELGWTPKEVGVLADLQDGTYFK